MLNESISFSQQSTWNFTIAVFALLILAALIFYMHIRRQADQALLESEEQFRILYNTSPDLYVSVSPEDARVLLCNDMLVESTGYSRAEIIGASVFDRYHEDCLTEAQDAFDLFIRTGVVRDKELTLKRKGGGKIEVSLNVNVVRDESGKISRSMWSWRDITDYKQAERALRESEERLRLSTELGGVAVWEYDFVERQFERSANHDRLFGLEPQGAIQERDHFMKYVHPDDLESVLQDVQDILKPSGQGKGRIDCRVIWPDGSVHSLMSVGEVAARDENGIAMKIRGCIIDVTDRKQMDDARQKSEARLIDAQRIARMGDFIWDFESGTITWSEALFELLQYDKTEEISFAKVNQDIFHPDDRKRVSQWLNGSIASGKTELTPNEYRVIRKDGEVLYVRVQGIIQRHKGKSTKIFATVQDITERKLAEEALRLSEANLLEAQEIARLGNWEMDVTTTLITWSNVNDRIFGIELPADGITFDTFINLVHPEDQESIYQFRDALATDGSANVEYRAVRPDSEIRWIAAEGKTTFDEAGRPVKMFGVLQDVTERKVAEDAIRTSEEKFRGIYEQSPVAIQIYDETGALIDANQQTLELFGIDDKRHILGYDMWSSRNYTQGTIDAVREGQSVYIEASLDFGAVKKANLLPTNRTGIIYLDLYVFPLKRAERITGYIVELVDITARKEAAAAVAQSEERFRGLYEQSPIAIQIYNEEGLLVDVNQQTLELFGINDIEEILGFNIWGEPNMTPEVTEALRNGRPVNFSGTLDFDEMKKAGVLPTTKIGKMYGTLHITPLMLNDEITGYLVQVIDETERKEMEARLLQAQKMESIGQLAGGIAHDFNNILVPIVGYTEMGMRRLTPDERLYAYFQRIQEAANRASGLTNQILAFSRQQLLEMQIVDVNTIVANFEALIQRLIGEDIALHTFLEPDLHQVSADAGQIEQVLMNLSVNARDAMPSGGNLTIETANVYLGQEYITKYSGAQAPGNYVMIAISDTGHGMDDATQRQIFDPFFTTKEHGEGTGLGLSTVFGIVKQHGGNIWVYSEPNKGATFKIYLPAVESEISVSATAILESETMYGSETILVVEDEEMVRQLVCESLAAHGYKLLDTGSPSSAIQLVNESQNRIHLLLTDVIMPEMNGKELYEKITAIDPNIKVLYMSGYTDNVIVHHGILDKDVNFLQKPFTIQDLTGKVRQVLSADSA